MNYEISLAITSGMYDLRRYLIGLISPNIHYYFYINILFYRKLKNVFK